MYLHLNSHVYISQFREEYILLDLKKDKYTICNSFLSESFSKFQFQEHGSLESLLLYDNKNGRKVIKKLFHDNIITKNEVPYPYFIDRKVNSTGVPNVNWKLPLESKSLKFNKNILKALWILSKVNFYMKFKGFYKTIQMIKVSRDDKEHYIIPTENDLTDLAHIVNQACFIYPKRTKCLEWAMTFVLLALKRKWKCNLEIGVQNYPFMAHAWVECDDKVVMDRQDLREGLAIILNEPFRRLNV